MKDVQQRMGSLTIDDAKLKKLDSLNNILAHFYKNEKVNKQTKEMIRDCAADLEKYIHQKFPYLNLKEYGSLATGFGNKDSDIDFSLILKERNMMNMEEHVVLKTVAKLVEGAQATWDIEFINAKVPIVTFNWKGLEVDISYINTPALLNTELLQQYCKWEPERLGILGFWVKKWAKAFDICNKMNGTLSSYTYILMVIYFLQRRRPRRVLPCIQTEFLNCVRDGIHSKSAKRLYYYKEFKPEWTKNKETVAELFLGFLEFYSTYNFGGTGMIYTSYIGGNLRRVKEFGAPIVVRDCIDRRVNVAAHVKQSTMDMIVGIIRLSRDELENWLNGKPVHDERIKKLFNIQ